MKLSADFVAIVAVDQSVVPQAQRVKATVAADIGL
jgi:hypothetical protein